MSNKIRKLSWLKNGIFVPKRLSESQKSWLDENCTGQYIVTSECRITCTNSEHVQSMLDEEYELQKISIMGFLLVFEKERDMAHFLLKWVEEDEDI